MIYELFDPIVVLVFFFIISLINKKHFKNTLVLLVATIIVFLLKVMINAPRPNGEPYGFPSGHATVWGSLLLISGIEYRKYFPLVAFLTGIVVFLALYAGYHYPIDLIGGFLLGISITLVMKVKDWQT